MDNQIKVDEMDGIHGMYGGEEKCIQNFGWETQTKETSWKTSA
jgi:hypothetical protein